MYSVSKILLNAYSIWLARSLSKSRPEDHQILVAAFTPGYTVTDLMVRRFRRSIQCRPTLEPKTAAQGADTGVWLALLPPEALPKGMENSFVTERNTVWEFWR